MAKIAKSFPRLTETNFNEWLVDIRAHLRSHKLWQYTQTPYDEKSSEISRTEWDEKAMDAADIMTLTITNSIKQKLKAEEFNNGYLMLQRLITLLQPTGETQFLRLTRELYTLRYSDFKDVSEFLTRVKVLEEQIAATKVEMTDDKRTLLVLTMALWEESGYRSLLQIWSATPNMTAEKAREMLMEEERREKADETVNVIRKEKDRCTHCKKLGHKKETCWKLHPELRSNTLESSTKGLHISC